MSEAKQSDYETGTFPNRDGRIPGKDGQPDVFVAKDFWRKVAYVVFSFAILLVGVWEIWGPLSRVFLGEIGEARVVRIVRESPGEPAEIIRIRREIKEGDYSFDTLFRYYVEVVDQDGNPQIFEMAVASRQTPYALVNENFRVAYFKGGDYAYGIWHHRTWAMGAALIMMGFTFVPLSIYLLRMVGKPIPIDPEDPEELEKERQALKREQELDSGGQ